MLFSVAACAQRDDSGGDDNKPPVVDPGGDSEGFIPRKKQEMPVAKIVDTDNDYGADSGWAGDAYASLDLGSVYLQDVINDTVYDGDTALSMRTVHIRCGGSVLPFTIPYTMRRAKI